MLIRRHYHLYWASLGYLLALCLIIKTNKNRGCSILQGSQVSSSQAYDDEVELKEVFHDETSLVDTSLASSLETSVEHSLYIDEEEELKRKRKLLSDVIVQISDGRISPIQCTSRLLWSDLGERQQSYYVRKAREVIETALNCLAPGCEVDLWRATIKSVPADESKDADVIEGLVEAYKSAENRETRLQLLSLFVNKFSKSQLQEIVPGVSKRQIDDARKHADLRGPGMQVNPPEIRRMRLKPAKTDHFLQFISTSSLLQDVAYGTKTIKLDSGEKLLVPAAIRTLIPSRIIRQYQSYCGSVDFEPYSERTLFRILEACSASKQVSLQGLDYFSTEGTEAFEKIQSIVSVLGDNGAEITWASKISNDLKANKRYLKTDFKTHVSSEERCNDHCTTFSLSDPSNTEYSRSCNHEHDLSCHECSKFADAIEEITTKLNDKSIHLTDDQRARLKFEQYQATNCIHAWKSHLLRTIVQENARQDVLNDLDSESTLMIMDWAMKFQPMKFREKMDDFFGKRGRSWHVTCAIKGDGSKVEVETFVHLLDSCVQDWFSVASIVEHTLSIIKAENPQITKVYLRSDNAGCYHNTELLLSLRAMADRHGMVFVRYDYSDPQSGKDVCDRRIASMKTHIRRWVNEGHDVTTAEEMKIALQSHGGVRGCRFAVVEIDKTKVNGEVAKIPGISFLNNFQFYEDGFRSWKAYQIGNGHFYSYASLITKAQENTELRVVVPFSPQPNYLGAFAVHSLETPQAEGLFSCSEQGCVKMFSTFDDLQKHLDGERHVFIGEQDTAYDVIRKKWAAILSGVSSSKQGPVPPVERSSNGAGVVGENERVLKGWALKTVKRSSRMSENVKGFLTEKFNHGAQTGKKADAKNVEHEMKHARNSNGELLFQPHEWRTSKQIASFFSRLSKSQRKNVATDVPVPECSDSDDEEPDYGNENFENLQNVVEIELQADHPIMFEGHNLCNLAQQGKLKELRLEVLKNACVEFNVEVIGHKTRKDSFIAPLYNFIFIHRSKACRHCRNL